MADAAPEMGGNTGATPNVGASNTAKAATGAGGFDFGKLWKDQAAKFQKASKGWQTAAKGVAENMGKQAQGVKINVKVDWFSPTIEAAKVTYSKLPPGVQQAMPYVGVGLASGTVAWTLATSMARKKEKVLRLEIDEMIVSSDQMAAKLVTTQEQLQKAIERVREAEAKVLAAKNGGQSNSEIVKMAKAVADATNAAASAARAAALAADSQSTCARPPAPAPAALPVTPVGTFPVADPDWLPAVTRQPPPPKPSLKI